MAERLIGEFGSLPDLLAASSEQLRRAGGSEQAIAAITAARSVVRRSLTARLESRPVLTRSSDFHQYLRAHIGYERVETVRVLYLDAAHRLIADEQAGRGRPDEAPFYVRTILGRALELSATGIVVAHNHPSGVLHPSSADRLVTNHLSRAAEVVGLVLLDHVIVTRGGCRSIGTGAIAVPSKGEARRRAASVVADAGSGFFEDPNAGATEADFPVKQHPSRGARKRQQDAAARNGVPASRSAGGPGVPNRLPGKAGSSVFHVFPLSEPLGIKVRLKRAGAAGNCPSGAAPG
jgi:DNA repair protein RadC